MSLSDMLDAIRRDNLDELRTLVSMEKCSDTEDLRNTLLHEAVKGNKKAITEFLLQDGSNPNSRVYSSTPFHISASYRIAEFLLQDGSNSNSAVYSSTPLHIAARSGYLEIIEILLNHGADINAKDDDGSSPLVYAIENKKNDAAQLLLERGPGLFSDNEGRSPLHVAVTEGSLNLAKMILQNGAPVNAVITSDCEKGYTPLHCACSSSRANIDIIEFLLSNEAGVNLKTEDGLTSLHIASQVGNVRVINLLLNYNADINVRDNCSYTPLYWAIEYKQEDAALMLIKKRAKVDDEFCNGDTVLRLAICRGFSSTLEEILTRCLDPQGEIEKCKRLFKTLPEEMINSLLKYCFDIEFFHTAIRGGYIQIIESILKDRLDLTANVDVIRSSVHIAVKNGHIKSLQVLISHGADVNGKDETGMTPLLNAVVDNNFFCTSSQFLNEADVKIAKMLLAAGADVNAATRAENRTPLHIACERSEPKLVEVFLDHNADVNLRDKNGKTALHFAAENKCYNATKLLLENKANVNSQDIDGCTALHSALYSMGSVIVELLLKFGADINIKDRNNRTPMHKALLGINPFIDDEATLYIRRHAFALDAINLYDINDLQFSLFLSKLSLILSKFHVTDKFDMESHLKNCKQEIEELKSVRVPGYNLTYYTLMTRSIHYVASYVKDEDLITHFASDDFTNAFPIYAPIIEGRLRNAFQRRPLIGDANEFFRHNFQLPHVCVDHILSCLSSDDLQNLKDAM